MIFAFHDIPKSSTILTMFFTIERIQESVLPNGNNHKDNLDPWDPLTIYDHIVPRSGF